MSKHYNRHYVLRKNFLVTSPIFLEMLLTDDPFYRIDTRLLYQPFYQRIRPVIEMLWEHGHRYVATCGYRSYAEQDKLYAIGRTTGRPGHHVTNARASFSPHNYAVAIDFCRDADGNLGNRGLKPDYTNIQYLQLAEAAKRVGLEPGYWWPHLADSPHVQLDLRSRHITWAALRGAHARGGQEAVVELLDQHGPW